MEVFTDSMPYIRTDSRATISSNGVLGDQLVDISVGTAGPVEDGGHIQSNLSLMEELMTFKDRFDAIVDNVNRSLEGVAEFGDALNTDQTKRAVQGFIANAETISKQIADGEGVVGGLVSDPEYKEEFEQTLKSVRKSAKSLETTMARVDSQIDPALRALRGAATSLGDLSDLAKDPNNPALVARLFNDAKLAEDIATAVADASGAIESTKTTLVEVQGLVAEVSRAITAGEGTLGKLIKDPKAYDDLVKALGNIERNAVIKKLVRYLYEAEEAASDGSRPVAPATADRD
jgi:ABC-type transporter Mla subunit MlaD